MALLSMAVVAKGFSSRRGLGVGLDSRAKIRKIWAAFHTEVRALGDKVQMRRRASFFRTVMASPERHLGQQPWSWRSLSGA